ncbi:MAG: hypothetical protein E3J94_06990 [Desulfobacteraceae bacterium]|nr:MAG: hypothetical protein E3J94_06990 [Desulfobacteraceae bacterium]
MKAINGIKVFNMSDFDWWAGADLESVKKAYLEETGLDAEEAFESDAPEELSDADLDRLRFHYDPDDRSKTISFREQLENMVRAGMSFPCVFASTEF